MPSFPVGAMIGSLGDLARELGKDNEVPEEFLFADALTVAGAIMSGRFTLDLGLESDTRLYTVTVGESADTKKTTAQTKVLKFFKSLGLDDSWGACHGIGSAEGLAKALDNCSRIVLTIDELKQLLQKTQIRGSVLLPMMTSLYERTDYENQTKETAIELNDARLSMMANSTLDTYEALWDHEALAIGLVNRLFLVTNAGKPRVAWPRNPSCNVLDGIADRLRKQILSPPPSPYQITLDALSAWTAWYETLPKSEFAKRLDGLGFRLMPILAATTDSESVDLSVVTAVTAILDYELQTRKALQPIDADNAIARMEQKIVRYVELAFPTRRELARGVHADRAGHWIFRTAIENMIQAKLIILDEGTGRYALAEHGVTDPQKPKGTVN